MDCGPHGVPPASYPVFSKPVFNLKGMGVGSHAIASAAELDQHYAPGHFWMELLEGEHVSTDCAIARGIAQWSRHTTGTPFGEGMFGTWTVHAEPRSDLENYLGAWIDRHLPGYTGMINFETIGGRIIEAHLRFADQWPDLYGPGWVKALIRLYAKHEWRFDDTSTANWLLATPLRPSWAWPIVIPSYGPGRCGSRHAGRVQCSNYLS